MLVASNYDDNGVIIARHRKMNVVKSKSEAWSTPGVDYTVVDWHL